MNYLMENYHPIKTLPNPCIKDTFTSPQVVSHPPFPISPFNSHATHTQAPSQNDNQTPYIKDTPTSQQGISRPPLPISPINSHETHTQVPPQCDNQTQHTSPLSPSKESLVDDINQLQDLSNFLAMHLSQQQQNNNSSLPYSPNLPHTLNINQVETHVGYCPCCIFTQKQFLALSEDINWIEFLLTRPHPPPRVQRDYPSTTASAPVTPPSSNTNVSYILQIICPIPFGVASKVQNPAMAIWNFLDRVRCLLSHAGLPASFWGFGAAKMFHTVIYEFLDARHLCIFPKMKDQSLMRRKLVRSRDVVFEEDLTLKDVKKAEREIIPQHNDDLIDLDLVPPKHFDSQFGDDIQNDEEQGADDVDAQEQPNLDGRRFILMFTRY
ncbi:hypothetical protein Tco_0791749 [Tanacetum coccineum]